MLRMFSGLAAGILAALPAQAAVLTNIEGTMWIDRGQGAVATATSSAVAPGNRIRAAANSAATLYYENGCIERIAAGQTIVVKVDPPCERAAVPPDDGKGALIVGGLVIGGTIAGIVSSSNNKPASP